MEIWRDTGGKPAAKEGRGYGRASLLVQLAKKQTLVFRASKPTKSQHAQRLASDRRTDFRRNRRGCVVRDGGEEAFRAVLRDRRRSLHSERKAGEGRSCQPAESGHSVLPLIVIAGKASNNGEARQGGRHDHEHWLAARSALEDGDRFRPGGLGSGARPGLRRRPDHRRADHQDQHQSILRENEGRRGGEGEGARRRLSSFAGKYDGDNTGQVDAIEQPDERGAKAILITPSDTKAIVPTIERARKAGILVIALDTPLDPPSAADATFATDNLKAGELIGQWAAKTLGDKAKDAHIAYIDALIDQPSVDRLRDFGFTKGFGIENSDRKHYGHETDKRIVGHQWGRGEEASGRAAMETLLQKDPNINVVYTINEPTAAGAYGALKAAGKDKGASSSRSTAAARASRTSRPASSARLRSNIRC